MHIKSAEILEEIQYKNKTFLCQIRVTPRPVKYFHGQNQSGETYHWMQPEQWADFDAGLQRFLEQHTNDKGKGFAKEGECFQLNALIRVEVRPASTQLQVLCDCMSRDKRRIKKTDIAMAIECVIEYRADGKWKNSDSNGNIEKSVDGTIFRNEVESTQQQSGVEEITSTPEQNEIEEYEPNANECHEEYVPYKASLIGKSDDFKTDFENELDQYIVPVMVGNSPDILPYSPKDAETVYIPSPKGATKQSKSKHFKDKRNKETDNNTMRKTNEIGSERKRPKESKTFSKDAGPPKRTDNELEDDYFQHSTQTKNSKRSEKSPSKIDNNHDKQNAGKSSSVTDNQPKSNVADYRRSPRQRNRPSRLIEETENYPSNRPNTLSAIKRKNLFGSDDGQSEDEQSVKSSKTKTSSNGNEPLVHKRKREIRDFFTSDKNTPKANVEQKKSKYSKIGCIVDEGKKSQSSARQDSLSPTGMDDEVERKSDLQDLFSKASTPSPQKVKILTLNDMDSSKILRSLQNYKSTLDKIYYKFKDSKNYVHGHDGINHCLVISLIDDNTQSKMLQKLSETYDKHTEGSSSRTTLFVNALLPEWIICLFMERHKLTRSDAIAHIKAQDEYRVHMAAKEDYC